MNFKNAKVPGSGSAGTILKVALVGGSAVYAAFNSLYNVEGGHRAIVFNRIQGIKDKVSLDSLSLFSLIASQFGTSFL